MSSYPPYWSRRNPPGTTSEIELVLSKKFTLLNFPEGTLFNRVNEVDPLTCAKSQGRMRIIAFIEGPEIAKKILKYLGLWD